MRADDQKYESLRLRLLRLGAEVARAPVRYSESYFTEPNGEIVMRASIVLSEGRPIRGAVIERRAPLEQLEQMITADVADSYLRGWWEEMRFDLIAKLEIEGERVFQS